MGRAKSGSPEFYCKACDQNFPIPWEALARLDGKLPACFVCGAKMSLVETKFEVITEAPAAPEPPAEPAKPNLVRLAIPEARHESWHLLGIFGAVVAVIGITVVILVAGHFRREHEQTRLAELREKERQESIAPYPKETPKPPARKPTLGPPEPPKIKMETPEPQIVQVPDSPRQPDRTPRKEPEITVAKRDKVPHKPQNDVQGNGPAGLPQVVKWPPDGFFPLDPTPSDYGFGGFTQEEVSRMRMELGQAIEYRPQDKETRDLVYKYAFEKKYHGAMHLREDAVKAIPEIDHGPKTHIVIDSLVRSLKLERHPRQKRFALLALGSFGAKASNTLPTLQHYANRNQPEEVRNAALTAIANVKNDASRNAETKRIAKTAPKLEREAAEDQASRDAAKKAGEERGE